jgi:ribonucleotide monophosphatase NagD (HAD superfamily)
LELTEIGSKAAAVIVGTDRAIDYDRLSNAVTAVRGGARLIATNTDPTYPVESGLLPGSGAFVAAVQVASGTMAEVAGKPNPAMRNLLRGKGIEEAWVIGDRLDTDIHMAQLEEGWRSVLVLSGVSAPEDDLAEADFVVPDLAAAVGVVIGRPTEG